MKNTNSQFPRLSKGIFILGIAVTGLSAAPSRAQAPQSVAQSQEESQSPSNRHRAAAARVPEGSSNTPVTPVIAPFFGNFSVVPAPTIDAVALVRQPDCSLTYLDIAVTINGGNSTATVRSEIPHYETTIHNNAFLTTTPGLYPKGCATSVVGTTSRNVLFLGPAKTGGQLLGVVAGSSLVVFTFSPEGTLTQSTLTTDNPPFSLVSADLNKDGNPDLISINTSGLAASITIFLGKADGTYQPGTSIALPGAVAEFGVIDDLDGDGNLDLLVGSGTPGFQFSIFLGKGDGTFQAPQTFTPAGNSISFSTLFITADVNGDNAKDIITSTGEVFLGKGDGVTYTLAPQLAFPPVHNATNDFAPGMIAADFNNDGKLDLIVDPGATIQTYQGKGDGTFTPGPVYASIDNSGFILATDLDGDGNLDIISGLGGPSFYAGDAFILNLTYPLMGNGNGTFQGAPVLPFNYTGTNLVDLNGDGRLDLIGRAPGSTFEFLTEIGQANGLFAPGPTLVPPVNSGADSWAVADFDGDHNADLIYVSPDPNSPGYYLALGNGNGSFQTPTFIPAPTFLAPGDIDINQVLTGIRTADFNHDGIPDIVYSFSDQSFQTQLFIQGFAVQLGNGNGTFKAPVITTTYSSLTAPLVFFSNMLSGVADVNGDNFPDVFLVLPTTIVAGTLQHQVELFVGKGDGSFDTPNVLTLTPNILPSTPDGGFGSPFALADLNGDGHPDLVASGSSADGTTPEVAIALGNGNGTFQPPTIWQLLGFGPAGSPAIADFDGDGKLDLAIPSSGENTTGGIFLGNGNGTFQSISNPGGTVSPIQDTVLASGGGAVAADLNGDGKPDLISGNVVLLSKFGQIVVTAPTSTAIMSSLNPSTSGASVTFTATVTSTTAGTITGMVTFFDGATSIGSGAVGAGGVATIAISSLALGPHSITAQYGGDANFALSTSPILTQTVNAAGIAATTTALGSSLNPSTSGANVTFTATVTSATAGTITGTVNFLDGVTSIGSGPVGAGGVATFTTSVLAVGPHSITAHYGGDANFATSTSPIVNQTVNAAVKAATSTALGSSLNPSTTGTSVTFTATVTSATAGTITGTVMFLDGATSIGNGNVGAGGVATFATSSLAVGPHSITAQYGGDTSFLTSTSPGVNQVVNAAADFSVSATPGMVTIVAGQTGMLALTVTPLNGSTQTVAFACGGLPSESSCGFMPPSQTLDGTHRVMTQVMISTTPRPSAAGQLSDPLSPESFRLLGAAAICMAGMLMLAFNRRRYPQLRTALPRLVFAALALAVPVMLLVACAGTPHTRNQGTPAGTYPITISAVSGNDTHSAPVSLVVQ